MQPRRRHALADGQGFISLGTSGVFFIANGAYRPNLIEACTPSVTPPGVCIRWLSCFGCELLAGYWVTMRTTKAH
jgi:hypothetical protein